MAQLFPPYNTILNLRQKPTEGELAILDQLVNNLDDTFEIYFQPFINGDMPDIIVLKENHGAYIIEVKDWDLRHYELNEVQDWYYKGNRIKSPMHQVKKYKENLFHLHIEGLAEKNVLHSNTFHIVKCAVYFHKATKDQLRAFLKPGCQQNTIEGKNRYADYIKFLNYFDIIGFDELNSYYINKITNRSPFKKEDSLFDEEIYNSFKRYLKPPFHTADQGKNFIYSDEQKKIIESRPNVRQKVKGVAGSGKTLCLAKRAVNAHLRHGGDVLIITFNITLRNYIRDKISEVRAGFHWKHFHILHYHAFKASVKNNLNIKGEDKEPEDITNSINHLKYKTILLDEIQDYLPEWIHFLTNKCLTDDGELVVYGDEKQNIYERQMDEKEKRPYTGIRGAWNLLKRSYRVSNAIARLSEIYQKSYFNNKYEIDEILVQRDLFEKSYLEFYTVNEFSEEAVYKIIKETTNKYSIHDNDVCVQSTKVAPLRLLEHYIGSTTPIKTISMFESQEVYDELVKRNKGEKPQKKDLDRIRRAKKFHFWNNPGIMKFCTIHSYKGWEVGTLFLLVGTNLIEDPEEENKEEYISDELVYTAITRCRSNLIVIEIGGNKYENFFKNNMEMVK